MSSNLLFRPHTNTVDPHVSYIIKQTKSNEGNGHFLDPSPELEFHIDIYMIPDNPDIGQHAVMPTTAQKVSNYYQEKFGLEAVAELLEAGRLTMKGTVDMVNKACDIEVLFVEVNKTSLFGHLKDYSVPAQLAEHIDYIAGLQSLPGTSFQNFRSSPGSPNTASPKDLNCSPPGPDQWTAADYAKFYNFPEHYQGKSLDGEGMTFGIIQFGGNWPEAVDYVQCYCKSVGIPFPEVEIIEQEGFIPDSDPGAMGEVVVNLELAATIVPKAKFQIYFARNNFSGMLWAFTTAMYGPMRGLTSSIPQVMSLSWAFNEPSTSYEIFDHLNEAIRRAAEEFGISIVAAAGDLGSTFHTDSVTEPDKHGLAISYPSANPYVLAAGGTFLNLAEIAKKVPNEMVLEVSEEVWNQLYVHGEMKIPVASGGGFSGIFKPHDYQIPFLEHYLQLAYPKLVSKVRTRGISDVSFISNSSTDGYFVIYGGGAGSTLLGTSGAAPMWGTLLCRVSQAMEEPLGNIGPIIYGESVKHSPAFANVIFYTNCLEIPKLKELVNGKWVASEGPWNPGTGLGSPNGIEFLKLCLATKEVAPNVAE